MNEEVINVLRDEILEIKKVVVKLKGRVVDAEIETARLKISLEVNTEAILVLKEGLENK